MPATRGFTVLLLLLLTSTAAHAIENDPPAPGDEAKEAAQQWLNGLGEKGLVINHVSKETGFTVKHAPSALGPITKFSFQAPGWWVTFSFKGKHTADTPVATLNKNFWHCAIDRIATPGLNVPGWEIRPRTPVSSFSKGVKLVSLADGKAKFQVKTSFFALYGRNPNVLVPADAPSPPGSYFQIRKNFPLDLTLEAPVSFK